MNDQDTEPSGSSDEKAATAVEARDAEKTAPSASKDESGTTAADAALTSTPDASATKVDGEDDAEASAVGEADEPSDDLRSDEEQSDEEQSDDGRSDDEPSDRTEAEAGATALARETERVGALFRRSDASVEAIGGEAFRFARWSTPIAPAFFGLAEDSVAVMQAGFREAAELAGAKLAGETDAAAPNVLVYAVDDWRGLRDAPQLGELVPDLEGLIRLLSVAGASQYRIFTFTPEHGLRFCVSLLRYDDTLAKLSAPSLALGQAVQALLLWSDEAFASESPVTVRRGGKALIKSRFARLLKAAYAPETPVYSEDPTLAAQLAQTMRAARRSSEDGASEQAADDAETGDDVGRRRRSRRRRGRGDDRAGSGDAASEADAASSESSDGSDQKAESDFDPLGGDPRPPETPSERGGGDDDEERSG